MIARNPASGIGALMRRVGRSESAEVPSRDAWTREELSTLLDVARAHEPRLYPALLLAFATGLRRGEVLGLQWTDIVVKRAELCVRRSISRGVAATPKSGRARIVAMPPSLVREIGGGVHEIVGWAEIGVLIE